MHYMHYKDYIHHGLAAEKTPPPLPQGGGTIWLGEGGVWGSLLIYIYISILIHELGVVLLGFQAQSVTDTVKFKSPRLIFLWMSCNP